MPKINPHRIILARESRGFTKATFAHSLGVSSGIHLETDVRIVSEDMLRHIAMALDYPASFFTQQGTIEPLDLIVIGEKAKPADLIRLQATLNILRLQVQQLTRALQLSPPHLSLLKIQATYGPVEAAKALRKEWNIRKGPVHNLTKLIEDCGIPIHVTDPDTKRIKGRIILTEEKYPIIWVNKTLPIDQKRLIMARCLGQLLLPLISSISSAAELDADAAQFATALLMPADDIATDLKGAPVSLSKLIFLKNKWQGTIADLASRADELGLMTADEKAAFKREYRRLHYHRVEPRLITVSDSKPSLLRAWLENLKTNLNLKSGHLPSWLHLSHVEFENQFGEDKKYDYSWPVGM